MYQNSQEVHQIKTENWFIAVQNVLAAAKDRRGECSMLDRSERIRLVLMRIVAGVTTGYSMINTYRPYIDSIHGFSSEGRDNANEDLDNVNEQYYDSSLYR